MGRHDEPGAARVVPIGADAADELQRLRARCEELEQANRAKDRMLAILGHELRAPLNAILGWTRRLQTEALGEDKRHRALDTIARNARTQQRLIEQLLEASRVSVEKLALVLAPIDLGVVVERVVEGFLPAACERRIELASLTREGIIVMADRERIEQVVTNLVGNALKHTESGGHVVVTTKRQGGLAVLAVKDDGQGIDPAFLPRVFDLYAQDANGSGASSGLGLGLHIVKTLVERHGGTVSAASNGSGTGAELTVRLVIHEGSVSGTRAKTTP